MPIRAEDGRHLPNLRGDERKPLLGEAKHIDLDVKGSDVAAGWAREMLELSAPRTVGAQFERVWLNGKLTGVLSFSCPPSSSNCLMSLSEFTFAIMSCPDTSESTTAF
jgi:hypothetical protein